MKRSGGLHFSFNITILNHYNAINTNLSNNNKDNINIH